MSRTSDEYLIITCPHCQLDILIYKQEINCRIFRHGVYKESMQQIPPHLDKTSCDNLSLENKIYGCGKPFRIHNVHNDNDNDNDIAEICDYI